jgi:hypothetical protein
MSTVAERIDGRLMIPDLLRSAPQVRPVLDRYGLRGCGGALGPVESLAFFARAHDIPLERLVGELRAAAAAPLALPLVGEEAPSAGDTIYRPFFKAGIAVVLTLGAVWGAYLLLRIAFEGSFRAIGLHEVNAHGHAQIFGWVGLFVMGFAYQAFPRFKHTSLVYPRLALASLGLMLGGIVGRCIGEPLAGTLPWLGPVAVAAGVVEVFAIGLFVWLIVRTWRASGQGFATYDYYLLAALFWFVVQAVGETVYLAATLAASPGELVGLVATWQGALREVQIHGFALLMILGVSQRLLRNFYGLKKPSSRLSLAGLACLNLAVLGEAAGAVLMRLSGHGWAALWYGSVLLLAGTVALLLVDWRVFGRAAEPDRSLKFVRAAYAWLLVSLSMLVLLPLYQHGVLPWAAPAGEAAQRGFSHACSGALRHAVTVGFISLMIVGVAARVVPTLNGVDVRKLSGLWAPFLLINLGCALRVLAQTATDFTPGAYPVAGLSGLLEVTGLVLWGAHLWRIMSRTQEAEFPATPADSEAPIRPTDRVADVLDRHPDFLPVFLAFGFRPLTSSLLRRTLARQVSLKDACGYLGVDLHRLLEALEAARAPAHEPACCRQCGGRD